VHQCARLRAKEKLLYVNLKNRIQRDIAMSGGDASPGRLIAVDKHIRGIQ